MKKINDHSQLVEGITVRNRIVMPPMDTLMAEDGFANDFHVQHYGSRAYGGVGTIIIESTAVSSEGRIREKDLGLWNDDQIEPLAKIVKIVKKAGAMIGIQLNHAGAKAELDEETLGTTAVWFDYLDQTHFHIVTKEELQRIEQDFVDAAKRAKKAGFDFVELHAAHGYLLNELYQPQLNEVIKDDDITKRAAVLINIAKRIHDEAQIPVGIRLSIVDENEKSTMTIEDMKPLVKTLEPYIEYIHVSSGETLGRRDTGKEIREAGTKMFRMRYAEIVRTWTDKPVITVGNFQTRADVDTALNKDIDFVAVGREQLFNPNLVVNNLLTADEMDVEDYHWNNNLWFDPVRYAQLLEMLKQ